MSATLWLAMKLLAAWLSLQARRGSEPFLPRGRGLALVVRQEATRPLIPPLLETKKIATPQAALALQL